MNDEEFALLTPTELKGLIISIVMIFAGRIFPPLIDSLPSHILPDIIVFLFLIMTPVGVILLIVFGFLTLLAGNDITQFLSITKIVVSPQGIALYDKHKANALLLQWQEIRAIKYIYLKHMFLGVVEARREPVGIDFNLVNGSNFKIPFHLFLKEKDRTRMVSAVSRYVSQIGINIVG